MAKRALEGTTGWRRRADWLADGRTKKGSYSWKLTFVHAVLEIGEIAQLLISRGATFQRGDLLAQLVPDAGVLRQHEKHVTQQRCRSIPTSEKHIHQLIPNPLRITGLLRQPLQKQVPLFLVVICRGLLLVVIGTVFQRLLDKLFDQLVAHLIAVFRLGISEKVSQRAQTCIFCNRVLRIIERTGEVVVVQFHTRKAFLEGLDAVSEQEFRSRINCVTEEQVLQVNRGAVGRDQGQ